MHLFFAVVPVSALRWRVYCSGETSCWLVHIRIKFPAAAYNRSNKNSGMGGAYEDGMEKVKEEEPGNLLF